MKTFLLILFLLFFTFVGFSQYNYFPVRNKPDTPNDMFDILRNAAYIDDLASFNYEHLFTFHENMALGAKLGLIIGDSYMLVPDVSLVAGGVRHFGEFGLGAIINTGSVVNFNFFDASILSGLEDDFYFTIRAGYRYQSPLGFLFKAGGLYSPPDKILVPLIGLGYCF